MAKPRGPTGSRQPSRRFGFVKLPGKAKRWRNESNPAFEPGATISDRKMSDIVREGRIGFRVSKENYQKGVVNKRFVYDDATRLRQRHAKHGRFISQFLPEMTRADRQTAFKWYDLVDNGDHNPARDGGPMAKADRERFRNLFKRYNADNVRQAFGSSPRDIGSFGIAA
jgi:hypothetical protein